MFCPLIRRRLSFVAIGLAAAFLLVWGAILVLAPTTWARDRIVKRLSEKTGRTVRLDRVRVGLCGGVRLENLTIAEPDRTSDPWLKVGSLTIDVNACHLLLGTVEPNTVKASGVALRVERKADGSFEFGDLFRADPDADSHDPDDGEHAERERVDFQIRDARILVVDVPSGSALDFRDLRGDGFWQHETATLTELKGTLDGGSFEMSAQLERGPGCPSFDTQVRIEQASIGRNAKALEYLIPIVGGSSRALDGKLDLALYLRGQGDTAALLRQTLAGQAALRVDPIALDKTLLLRELDGVVDLPRTARLGSIEGELQIAHGRISTKDLQINLGRTPLSLCGWTDFDGRLDYRLRTELLAERVAKEAGGLLAELPDAVDDLFETRLSGTRDNLVLTIDGVPFDKDARRPDGRPMDDRARLRQIGRRLRDRLLR